MRNEKTVEVNGKNITIYELSLKQIRDIYELFKSEKTINEVIKDMFPKFFRALFLS